MYCREWFVYRKALSQLTLEYEDCPVVCKQAEKRIDIRRDSYCDKCLRTKRKQEFFRRVERVWELWLEAEVKEVSLAQMELLLWRILLVKENNDRDLSASTGRLLDIYAAEEARHQRIEREVASAG